MSRISDPKQLQIPLSISFVNLYNILGVHMLTLLWFAFSTIVGYFVGGYYWPEVLNAELIGAGVGLVVGVLIRIGGGEALGDFGGSFDGGGD